jgi:hypothetical protein
MGSNSESDSQVAADKRLLRIEFEPRRGFASGTTQRLALRPPLRECLSRAHRNKLPLDFSREPQDCRRNAAG